MAVDMSALLRSNEERKKKADQFLRERYGVTTKEPEVNLSALIPKPQNVVNPIAYGVNAVNTALLPKMVTEAGKAASQLAGQPKPVNWQTRPYWQPWEEDEYNGLTDAKSRIGGTEEATYTNELEKLRMDNSLSQEEYQKRLAELQANDPFAQNREKISTLEQSKVKAHQRDAVSSYEGVMSLPDFAEHAEAAKGGIKTQQEYFSKYGNATEAAKNVKIENPVYYQWLNREQTINGNKERSSSLSVPYMTENEMNVYNYYFSKYGKQKADEYYKKLEPILYDRSFEESDRIIREEMPDYAKVVLPILTDMVAPFAFTENAFNVLRGADTDSNRGINSLVRLGGVAQQDVLKDAGPLGQFLGNIGYSIVNMGTKLPFGPVGGLAYMSSSAAGHTTADALERGADSKTALMLGALSGAIELATEKLPLDNLFKVAKQGGRQSVTQAVKGIFKQAGIEATEETVSEYTNTIVDMALMGEQSEYMLYKNSLLEQGMSETEATKLANLKFFVENPFVAAAGGAVSGGFFGTGASVINAAKNGMALSTYRNIVLPDGKTVQVQVGENGNPVETSQNVAQSTSSESNVISPIEAENAPVNGTDAVIAVIAPVRVGMDTTIKSPYQGTTPINFNSVSKSKPVITKEQVQQARQIVDAANTQHETSFKRYLKDAYQKVIGNRFNGTKVRVKGVTFQDAPYDVTLHKNVIGKVVSDPNFSVEKISVLNQLENVVGNAEYVGSGNFDKTGKRTNNVERYDYFETVVSLPSENGTTDYVVSFDTEIYPYENKFRTYKIKNIDLTPLSEVLAGTAPVANGNNAGLSTPIIPNSSQNSNRVFAPGITSTVENGQNVSWTETQKDGVSNPAKAFEEKWGIKTKVVTPNTETSATAFLKDGTLYLNADKVNTFYGALSKIAHEATHAVENTPAWNEIKKAAAAYYRAVDPNLRPSVMREAVRERYKGVAELTGDQAAAEVVAGFIEDICAQNSKVGERASRILLEKSQNGFKRVVQFLKDKVESLKAYMPVGTGLSKQQRYALQAAQSGLRHLEKALKAYRKGKAEAVQGTKYSYAGKYDYSKSFSQQVDDYKNGKIPRGDTLLVGSTDVTETQQFKRWFGDWQKHPQNASKVVNADGTPKVVYHGTNSAPFYVFDSEKSDKRVKLNRLGNGYYFTNSKYTAERYGKNVMSVYLDIKKPYRVYARDGGMMQQIAEDFHMNVDGISRNDIQMILTTHGYDGVLLYTSKYAGNDEFSTAVVFKQNQIKSATDNIGTFDGSNPDIRYSYGKGSFTDYYLEFLNKKYGTIPKGENAYREVSVPRQTGEGTKTRRAVRTILEAESTPDSAVEAIKKDLAKEAYAYTPEGDKAALDRAGKTIQTRGFQGALDRWNAAVNGAEPVGKEMMALGETLMAEAGKNGDIKLFQKLAAEIAAEATNAGQAVQAVKLIKKFTPEGQLYYVQKAVDGLQKKLDRRMKGKAPELELDPELAKKLLEARTAEEMETASMDILKSIAEQTPSTWQDKWDAWRYFSMLANPRTHIRNILGNTVFVPARMMKNGAVMLAERMVSPEERTQAFLTKADQPLREFAKQNFETVKDSLTSTGKMNPSNIINELRPVYTSKAFAWLENLRKLNNRALEAEDLFFLKRAYVSSMAKAMKARGLDADFLQSGTREATSQLRALEKLAAQEALEATYRDASSTASALNRFKETNKATDIIGNALFPFTKTPVNVLKRGVEYSPVGLIKGVVDMTYGLKTGKKTAAEAVGSLCKGVSGLGIAALGYWLASMGLLVAGGPEDDRERSFETLQGAKTYALKIGDIYYTIDWMAPVALPLFVGAEMQNAAEGEGFSAANIIDSLTKISEPMFNLSMLDGLNSMFKSISYGSTAPLADFAVNAAKDYITQALPTLGGQIARTIDPTARNSYYIDKKSPIPPAVQEFLNAAQAKIPFLSFFLSPKIDQWGRTSVKENVMVRAFENFISPGYISTRNETPVDKEIAKIYKETGETSILPKNADKYFTVDGETNRLSAKEYTEYAQERGQRSFKYINELLSNSDYQKLNADEKVEVIQLMYQVANAEAKKEVEPDYDIPKTVIKAYEANKQAGILYGDYYLYKMGLDSNPNQREVIEALNKTGLSKSQKQFLFEQRFPKSKRKPFG